MLETFLEAILWKLFQPFRRMLSDFIIITKARLFNANFIGGNK